MASGIGAYYSPNKTQPVTAAGVGSYYQAPLATSGLGSYPLAVSGTETTSKLPYWAVVSVIALGIFVLLNRRSK